MSLVSWRWVAQTKNAQTPWTTAAPTPNKHTPPTTPQPQPVPVRSRRKTPCGQILAINRIARLRFWGDRGPMAREAGTKPRAEGLEPRWPVGNTRKTVAFGRDPSARRRPPLRQTHALPFRSGAYRRIRPGARKPTAMISFFSLYGVGPQRSLADTRFARAQWHNEWVSGPPGTRRPRVPIAEARSNARGVHQPCSAGSIMG